MLVLISMDPSLAELIEAWIRDEKLPLKLEILGNVYNWSIWIRETGMWIVTLQVDHPTGYGEVATEISEVPEWVPLGDPSDPNFFKQLRKKLCWGVLESYK